MDIQLEQYENKTDVKKTKRRLREDQIFESNIKSKPKDYNKMIIELINQYNETRDPKIKKKLEIVLQVLKKNILT